MKYLKFKQYQNDHGYFLNDVQLIVMLEKIQYLTEKINIFLLIDPSLHSLVVFLFIGFLENVLKLFPISQLQLLGTWHTYSRKNLICVDFINQI
jgi:hypothetical protein